jgi:hypothetical protein
MLILLVNDVSNLQHMMSTKRNLTNNIQQIRTSDKSGLIFIYMFICFVRSEREDKLRAKEANKHMMCVCVYV